MKNKTIKRAIATILLLVVAVLSFETSMISAMADITVSDNMIPQIEQIQAETVQEIKKESAQETVTEEIPAVEVVTQDVEPVAVSANDTGEPEKIKVAKVKKLSVTTKSYKSLIIKYKAVAGVDGYEIYRGTSKKKMKRIADLKAVRTSYTDTGLETNKKYYYKVRAYVYDANNKKVRGKFSSIVSGKPLLNVPVLSTAKAVNYKTIKLTYEKVSGASGYVIYRSDKKNSGYKKVGTVKKGKTLTFTDKTCKTGKKHYYKVRAYRTVNGKNKYSDYSKPISAKTKLGSTKTINVGVTSADTALVTWKKVSGASGYKIYRSETSKEGYKCVATINGGKTLQAYVNGQENGKTYYYKVRAYRKVDGKNVYSKYSGVKKASFNFLASANETYQEKAQRIFGLDYYKKYSSKAEAELHMTTIVIDVWDFAPDGVTKVTKQRTLTVHKNIASTVQQIFKEIYEGEEKFPIKNIGGYSWRGDTSRSEHCCGLAIDINWEENYLIDNGVIISGKLYKPGENPYSIPTDGEVAKIMNKYGFRQGLWGTRCDYMHFSYFGT